MAFGESQLKRASTPFTHNVAALNVKGIWVGTVAVGKTCCLILGFIQIGVDT